MTKHFCWICHKEIFSEEERSKRALDNFFYVVIEEVCNECENAITEFMRERERCLPHL